MSEIESIGMKLTYDQKKKMRKILRVIRVMFIWMGKEWNKIKMGDMSRVPDSGVILSRFRGVRDREYGWMGEVDRVVEENAVYRLVKAVVLSKMRDREYVRWKIRRRRVDYYVKAEDLRWGECEVGVPGVGWVELAHPIRCGGRITGGVFYEKKGKWMMRVLVRG